MQKSYPSNIWPQVFMLFCIDGAIAKHEQLQVVALSVELISSASNLRNDVFTAYSVAPKTRVPKNRYPVRANEHTLSEYCTCSNNYNTVAGVLHCTRLSS